MFCSQGFLEKCQPLDLHVASLQGLVKEINKETPDLQRTDDCVNDSDEPLAKRSNAHCYGDKKQKGTDTSNEPSVRYPKTHCDGDAKPTINGEKCIDAFSPDSCYPTCDTDSYILDVDLDFFSVTNPFLQDYTVVCMTSSSNP